MAKGRGHHGHPDRAEKHPHGHMLERHPGNDEHSHGGAIHHSTHPKQFHKAGEAFHDGHMAGFDTGTTGAERVKKDFPKEEAMPEASAHGNVNEPNAKGGY